MVFRNGLDITIPLIVVAAICLAGFVLAIVALVMSKSRLFLISGSVSLAIAVGLVVGWIALFALAYSTEP